MATVRISTDRNDAAAVYALLVEFGRAAKLPEPFSTQEEFVDVWGSLLDSGAAFMVLAEEDGRLVGILGALVGPRIYWASLGAQEAFWWVTPEYRGKMLGIRMLKMFEDEARRQGCKVAGAGHKTFFMAEEMSGLYKRLGYSSLETIYQKEL